MVMTMFIAMAMSAHAADLSQKALNFRTQIKSYLSSGGYEPSIDSDGDVKFKYNGYTYYIRVVDISGDIMVRYMVGVTVPDNVGRGRANKICLNIAQKKLCARAFLTESGSTIFVQIDAFCSGLSMFKSLFEANMMLLDTVSDDVVSELQNS